MSAREVVTIQCGHFSNFIGSHWWNIQESGFCYDPSSNEPQEILHDCLFREGLTLTGQQTYTPRLISIDLPGSLKSLREEGVLYGTKETREKKAGSGGAEKGVWSGGVNVFETEPVSRNEYLKDLEREERGVAADPHQVGEMEKERWYDLESSVEVWSDFMRLHLHSKSLLMVPGHFHNDSNDTFGSFPSGLAVWDNRKFRTQLEDKLHFFVEECDRLQGFHLLCDWSDGFGGLASCIAEDLRDEYGNKGILTFLSSPLDTPLDKFPKFYPLAMNSLLSLSRLCQLSSAVVPLSLLAQPWQSPTTLTTAFSSSYINPALWYHTSAVFASALETTTLFYRTHHNLTTLPLLTDSLTAAGRKICSLGVSLPFSLPPHGNLASQLTLSPLPSSLSPLSPFANIHDDTLWSLATSLRGTPPNYPLSSGEDLHYGVCSHPSHVLAVHLSETVPSVNSLLCCIQKPLPLATPFPRILPDDIMTSRQTPVCASLQTQSSTKHLLLSLLSLVNPSHTRQFPVYAETCLDRDNTAELVQNVSLLADCYSVGGPPSEEDSD